MYKKLIVAAVLVAFACVQLASALECYSCSTGNCASPSKDTCSATTAQKTNTTLSQHFINVPVVNTNNFDCLRLNYTTGTVLQMEVRGCIWRETNSCSLQANASVIQGTWSRNCSTCSGNLCNGYNSAGSFSTSTFTLFASVLGVLIVKKFA